MLRKTILEKGIAQECTSFHYSQSFTALATNFVRTLWKIEIQNPIRIRTANQTSVAAPWQNINLFIQNMNDYRQYA